MKHIKKQLSWLLMVCMILGLIPLNVSAAENTSDITETLTNGSVTVIAGSDFQNPDGNDAGAKTVTSILTQMQKVGYMEADGFLFCGDYDYSTVGNKDSTEAGITALKNAVTGVYTTLKDDRMVMVEGNHDYADASGLATSGAHDADEYGVYVINEDDYMWKNSDVTTIQNTANALDNYLDSKIEEGYQKPIFVVSHLPLHYSMRTKNDGDGMYANYIFDVLDVGQRIEGDANDKLFFRPLKNRPRSLGANGRLTAIIRHIIGEY